MEKLLLTLVTLVLVPSCSSQSSSCSNYPCPKYQVVETNEDFEERRYVDTDWITTKLSSRDSSAFMAASKTLRAFCNKQKEAGHEVLDGWPILITSTDGETPSTSLSWFLAPGSNPEITDTLVTPEHKAATTIYVRSYSGTPSRTTAEENKKILSEALTKAGKKFVSDIYIGAHYESFFALSHHNEVWMYSA
uniref:Heme-binding protein soul2 n=1 Tax=Xiphophorus maculatus TaxID=8083 RepID=M3ZTX9_XIPMA